MSLDLVTQLYVDGAWTTYTSYAGEGWSTSVGPDPETGTQPNRLEFTLADPDLEMDPTNVESALYGKIGRNTPARVVVDGDIVTVAEASSWQPDRTVEHQPGANRGLSMISLVGEGLLRRIGKWDDPLDSPLRRQTASYLSLIGYWPLEDPSGAANLAQLVNRVAPGTYTGTLTLAGDEGPGGSGPTLVIGTSARIDGRFAGSSGSGWQICWAMKLAAVPGSAAYNTVMAIVDTIGRTWQWQISNANFQIVVSDADGTVLETSSVAYGTTPITDWIRYRLKVTISGSTITYEPAWYVQDGSFITGWTDTFTASVTARPRDWRITFNSYVDGASYGHMFAVTDTTLNLAGAGEALAAFNGYLGERAGTRFARLMDEAGLTRWTMGTAADSAPMGRQKPGKLLDLLEECARSDGGLLFDDPVDDSGENRLTIRLYNDLIDQTSVLDLTYGTNLSPPLRKVIDDVNVANDVTVTNYDGSEVHVEQTTGALSTAPPPAGVGRYRLPLAVSLLDPEQVTDRGNWELNKGTVDRPRYQAVVVDLLSNPSLRATVTAIRPGDLITLAGVEPDPVPLMVMNIGRAGDAVRDTATLKCVPYDIYQVLLTDDAAHLATSATSTLTGALTTTGTSARIGTIDPKDVWSTTGTPYDAVMTGERVTVTAMGSTGADLFGTETFETGVQSFEGSSCTVAQSSAQAHAGTFSVLATVTGSPSSATALKSFAQSPYVVPGQGFIYRIWVRSPTALGDVRGTVGWYDADGGFLSKNDDGTSLAANTWVQREVVATAPDGAVFARYGLLIGSSPAAGTQVFIDDSRFFSTTMVYQTATLTRSANAVVKTHTGGEKFGIAFPKRFGL